MTERREIEQALIPIRSDVAALREGLTTSLAIIQILLARHSDVTHVSIREAALIHKTSRKVVRARFRAALERIPGKKGHFIPLSKLFSGWLPIEAAKRIVQKRIAA